MPRGGTAPASRPDSTGGAASGREAEEGLRRGEAEEGSRLSYLTLLFGWRAHESVVTRLEFLPTIEGARRAALC